MNAEELRNLTESYYYDVYDYEVIDEVKGFGSHIDLNTGKLTGRETQSQRNFDKFAKNPSEILSGKIPNPLRTMPKGGDKSTAPTNPLRAGQWRGSSSWHDANRPDLAMPPARRAELAAKRAERLGQKQRANKIRTRIANLQNQNDNVDESHDLYDIVLEHLLYEGYADNINNAQVIMANMSDEWLGGILGEAKSLKKTLKQSIKNLNSIPKEQRPDDDPDDEHLFNRDEGRYREVPTDWPARRRRASGR